MEKSISLDGDSGPYLQYAYARANSLLERSGKEPEFENIPSVVSEFEKLLPRFVEVVEKSSTEFEPHHLVLYLTDLASAFNTWYSSVKVIDSEYEGYYLSLVKAFAITMKNGLALLGIPSPEKM